MEEEDGLEIGQTTKIPDLKPVLTTKPRISILDTKSARGIDFINVSLTKEQCQKLDAAIKKIKDCYDLIEEEQSLVKEYLEEAAADTGLKAMRIRTLARLAHKGDAQQKFNEASENFEILNHLKDVIETNE